MAGCIGAHALTDSAIGVATGQIAKTSSGKTLTRLRPLKPNTWIAGIAWRPEPLDTSASHQHS
ncbi:hypothetical protein MHAE_19171 [Mycobacterium haemophilum DSM 44634]|nr:hypothetical protein B586_01125 [Mycobacterium haemophilum DSM 44634]